MGLQAAPKGRNNIAQGNALGSLFHDPWTEVEIYRERGEWGSRPQPGTGTWIITDYNHQHFVETLLACPNTM